MKEESKMNDITSKSIAEQYAGKCVHFNGVGSKVCNAGVDYDTFPGPIPCLARVMDAPPCALRHFPDAGEVAAHVADMDAHMQRRREDNALIGTAHTDGGPSTVFVCELCERAARFVTTLRPQMIFHLEEAHRVQEADIAAAKGGMVAHLDAAGWSQTDDRFTLPDGRVFLTRSTRLPRRGSNKAAWGDGVPKQRRGRR